jgi:hypothetical protein
MSKLANPIALFCSHDNTGYLVKYIDPVLGLDKNQFTSLQVVIYSHEMSFQILQFGLD